MNAFARSSLLLALALGVTTPALAEPSNKWRIEVDDVARSSGEIELSFTPLGAPPSAIVEHILSHLRIPTRASFARTSGKGV